MTQEPLDLVNYKTFVLSKETKPRNLNELEFRICHAIFGLTGEYLELHESKTQENTLEELGDFFFYLTMLADCTNVNLHSVCLDKAPIYSLLKSLENVVDEHKKHVFYSTPRELLPHVEELYRSFVWVARSYFLSLEDIMKHNVNKLSQRYKEGFTPEESLARNDKETA